MTLPLNRNKVTITHTGARLYPFEGQMLSVKQIHERVTAVSESVIRDRLKEGVSTIAGMLDERKAKAAQVAGTKRGGEHLRRESWASADDRKRRAQNWKETGSSR